MVGVLVALFWTTFFTTFQKRDCRLDICSLTKKAIRSWARGGASDIYRPATVAKSSRESAENSVEWFCISPRVVINPTSCDIILARSRCLYIYIHPRARATPSREVPDTHQYFLLFGNPHAHPWGLESRIEGVACEIHSNIDSHRRRGSKSPTICFPVTFSQLSQKGEKLQYALWGRLPINACAHTPNLGVVCDSPQAISSIYRSKRSKRNVRCDVPRSITLLHGTYKCTYKSDSTFFASKRLTRTFRQRLHPHFKRHNKTLINYFTRSDPGQNGCFARPALFCPILHNNNSVCRRCVSTLHTYYMETTKKMSVPDLQETNYIIAVEHDDQIDATSNSGPLAHWGPACCGPCSTLYE